MKILEVNKYYYLRGGSERYLFDITALLEQAGHEVVPFSMKNDRNRPTPFENDFLDEIDYRADRPLVQKLGEAARVIWNREAYRKTKAIVKRERPDIAHLHNIAHQLSGSVVAALHDMGVPMVQTMHDYKRICPAYTLFQGGKVCERCKKRRYWNPIVHKCLLGSRAASTVAALEATWYGMTGLHEKIDRLHAPSHFMRHKLMEWGIDGKTIEYVPYGLDLTRYRAARDDEDQGYFLYAGRLSREKGLRMALKAARHAPHARIVVAGEGPLRERLTREFADLGDRLRFDGYLDTPSLHDAIRGSRAVLLPSQWYENAPFAIYEAFALGKPVIGSDRGGVPEMVKPGDTGWIEPPDDVEAWARAMENVSEAAKQAAKRGRAGRQAMETIYTTEAHTKAMLNMFEKV
ncbi:MAG: glycosyltransferase, partial [Gemmatimonadetes bacterium]|nr:glycosyltransferase [Gemmatimonadota bacterium]